MPQLAALPLWPQPDHAAKGNQAADDGVDKAGDDELLAVQRQNLQGIHGGDSKANGGPAVVATDNQVAPQRDDKHACQRQPFRRMEVQDDGGNHQPRQRARRAVEYTYAGCAVAVLRDQQHRHQDPVRLR